MFPNGNYLLQLAILCISASAKDAVDYVNPLIGNGGESANESGGMVPSTAPPFAMSRWVAQTRQNYVSVTPYNYSDTSIHGFQSTNQPAIWMGESGQVVVVPGGGEVRSAFEDRGMSFSHDKEVVSASLYSVELEAAEGGKIFVEQSATSRVGQLRFKFTSTSTPYVLIEATRLSALFSSTPNSSHTTPVTPYGHIYISPSTLEITGSNSERQDSIIEPVSTPATGFKGYFCARFDRPFETWGISRNGTMYEGAEAGEGILLSGFVRFDFGSAKEKVVNVRVGVSFISIEQARKNLDTEIPDGTSLEETAGKTRKAWQEKLGRIKIEGASEDSKTVFYTGFFHTLQYPSEQSEDGRYYSGYDDNVHEGVSYTGYSIWDTFRAEWAWLILFAPERVPGMITSMLQDYKEGGWLPMWKNIIETNIMVGTHADSLIAEAVAKGITGFDLETAYEAVLKDATVPPRDDRNTWYFDREEGVDYEVRAGLTEYAEKGWVANDIHAESASRTMDYAYDDYALFILASALNKTSPSDIAPSFFRNRASHAAFTLYNRDTNFMEARNADGSWAGPDEGWTEGDKWAYSFAVVFDVPGLVERRGGKQRFVQSLENHFEGGHNDHTNEPSHHIPYLYSLADAASKSQERIREIALKNYNATVNGLSGNEDCGQMSAWYLFSALGFYPVNPVSGEYVVGSPFFDRVTIDLPGSPKPLVISSPGAPKNIYVKSLSVHGAEIRDPVIKHEQIASGGEIVFEMRDTRQTWSNDVVSQTEVEMGHDEL